MLPGTLEKYTKFLLNSYFNSEPHAKVVSPRNSRKPSMIHCLNS